ncbi:uncharacterized abhydrolase domain-containing protein DDB_G0269086-like [Brachypodium distachyon]|uniref:uncharacterized abhydrolase domain-containing protein DDB_G0269086-like n=1 Tax=Brachypodium distachyon TaxID=15368 RepID=UPI000D0CF747|nr:uncharacterized abhydrolase domain-containing protein DDB_G0269086-like [Brachypodium distachyon]|eukprot:XP_024314577.1 uncharacterized abhydrolase domain-containing protein DDB_G0269086-like [Brachypodium distachyon]
MIQLPLRVTPSPGVRLKYAINSPRPGEVLPSRGKKVASKPKAEKKEKVKKFKDVPAPTAEEILVFYSLEEDVEEETRMKRKHCLQHIIRKHSRVLAAEIRRRTKEAESANLYFPAPKLGNFKIARKEGGPHREEFNRRALQIIRDINYVDLSKKPKSKKDSDTEYSDVFLSEPAVELCGPARASRIRGSSLPPLAPRNKPSEDSKGKAKMPGKRNAAEDAEKQFKKDLKKARKASVVGLGTLPDSLTSHVEGLIVAKTRAEEWEQNRSLRVARRLEEEDHAEKERVEKEKAEAALKQKKVAELQKKKAKKEAEEKKRKKKKALLAEQMKQAAESLKADKAKSEARKKATEKMPEVQGGNEEVDREKTEYEKMRDAARETRREVGLKARHDTAAPSDSEESQDLPQTVPSKKITMTRQASQIAEVKKTAKEFGLKIKVPAERSSSTSSSAAVSLKKAIDTLVPDTSTVKLTSLAEEQEQAASSPTVLSEHTAQQEEGDEVLGKNQKDIIRLEEPPTSSSLPRTESVDASAEEGRTCDFEAEPTRDLHANDAETDADAPVPMPEVRVKKVVKKKKFVAPSDPDSSSDEEKEEKEEERDPTQASDDLMEIDRLPEDLLKPAPKKRRSRLAKDREDRRLSRMLVRSQTMSEDNRELLSPKPKMPISSD